MPKIVASQAATLPADPFVREFLTHLGGKAQKQDYALNPSF